MIDPFTILFFLPDRHLTDTWQRPAGYKYLYISTNDRFYIFIQGGDGALTFFLRVYYIFFYAYSDICFYIPMQLLVSYRPLANFPG